MHQLVTRHQAAVACSTFIAGPFACPAWIDAHLNAVFVVIFDRVQLHLDGLTQPTRWSDGNFCAVKAFRRVRELAINLFELLLAVFIQQVDKGGVFDIVLGKFKQIGKGFPGEPEPGPMAG